MSSDLTEDEGLGLLANARAGDDSSFWRLCETLRPRLKRAVAQSVTPDLWAKLDPSDVVQCALVAALQSFGTFRGSSLQEWEAWIGQITRNQAKDAVRFWHQQRRSLKRQESLDKDENVEWPAISASPSGHLLRREESDRILAALSRLPEDEQTVVRLRHIEGKSLEHISQAISRSPGGTAGLLKRAMARLRKALSEEP